MDWVKVGFPARLHSDDWRVTKVRFHLNHFLSCRLGASAGNVENSAVVVQTNFWPYVSKCFSSCAMHYDSSLQLHSFPSCSDQPPDRAIL